MLRPSGFPWVLVVAAATGACSLLAPSDAALMGNGVADGGGRGVDAGLDAADAPAEGARGDAPSDALPDGLDAHVDAADAGDAGVRTDGGCLAAGLPCTTGSQCCSTRCHPGKNVCE